MISRGRWPPRSPVLNICDFYLRGDLEQKVNVNNPHTLQELENEIRRVLCEITERERERERVAKGVSEFSTSL